MPGLTGTHPPRGPLRLAARLPLWLYRAHLGWLLGNRFLMLTHIGRRSGLPRQVVLEVVRYDNSTGTYIIASGWGEKSDWFRNIQKTPDVVVSAGRKRFEARAVRLPVEEAERELRDYARRHPLAFRELSGLMAGQRLRGTDEDFERLAQSVPLVALRPRTTPARSS
ncbi:MAG: nitroreductase family deazaflavin-dependent oxidoreductase [Ardenticatenaceae bacterium]|nr:nitroreductase family deazaflavin-dependent oxidoreductase [Ardenticatenaceae bacterium]HBY92828.1 nitroreductase family deazaflavin-dependent oxidoreductase [Chloroflexota bacterium]